MKRFLLALALSLPCGAAFSQDREGALSLSCAIVNLINEGRYAEAAAATRELSKALGALMPPPSASPAAVDASVLFAAYEANEMKAAMEYGIGRVAVRGRV